MRYGIRLNIDGGAGGGAGAGGGGAGGGAGAAGGAAGGSAAGTAPDWRSTLPQELQANPSLTKFNSLADLASGYVNAQQLIGQRRLVAPADNWTDKEWGQLYDQLGRPPAPDKYTTPEVKLEAGVQVDPNKLLQAKQTFHRLGLNDKQGAEVLKFYLESVNGSAKEVAQQQAALRETAMADLKGTYGDKVDQKLQLGREAAIKVGGDEFIKYLEGGAGNEPAVIKMMIKLGEMIGADSSRGGEGGGNQMSSAQQAAVAKIAELKQNPNFVKQLTTQHDPGHKEAVEVWANTFKLAYPGKQVS